MGSFLGSTSKFQVWSEAVSAMRMEPLLGSAFFGGEGNLRVASQRCGQTFGSVWEKDDRIGRLTMRRVGQGSGFWRQRGGGQRRGGEGIRKSDLQNLCPIGEKFCAFDFLKIPAFIQGCVMRSACGMAFGVELRWIEFGLARIEGGISWNGFLF